MGKISMHVSDWKLNDIPVRVANSSTDLDFSPLTSTIHINVAPRQEEDDTDGQIENKTNVKEEDDDMQPAADKTNITEVVFVEGATKKETEENVPATTPLVRQQAIIKEPLNAAMADLAASIDGLDTGDTPRGAGQGGEGGVEKSLMPTSDFEEEWRSESEDGELSDQILQVVAFIEFPTSLHFHRLLSPLTVSSHR